MAFSKCGYKGVVLGVSNKLIVMSKFSILGVLHIRVYPSISNCQPLKVDAKILTVLDEVGRYRWDVMPSIRLPCDVEVSAFELWVLFKPSINEIMHVCCDLRFFGVIVCDCRL